MFFFLFQSIYCVRLFAFMFEKFLCFLHYGWNSLCHARFYVDECLGEEVQGCINYSISIN